jgi:hypothetical protein
LKLIACIQRAGKWAQIKWRRLTASIHHPATPEFRLSAPNQPGHQHRNQPQAHRHPDSRQAGLTASAINEWDIRRGCETVGHITLPFLLRRIAGSARQDAIRMAAALRLNDPSVVHAVTLGVKDVALRWRAAQYLNDPLIMTDVAVYKPCDERFDHIRTQAYKALIQHLDRLHCEGLSDQLLAYLYAVEQTKFKMEAFVRLPEKQIQPAVLRHMAARNYCYISETTINSFFAKIQSSGWQITQSLHNMPCDHCLGRGQVVVNGSEADAGDPTSYIFACPECSASGKMAYRKITCACDAQPPVVFRLLEDPT